MKHLSALQVSASLDGTLSGTELESVVKHLGACRECRDRHSSLSKQNDALRRLLAFEPSERQLAESLALVEAALYAEVRDVPRAPVRAPAPLAAPAPVIDMQPTPAPAPRAPLAARAPLRIPAALVSAAAAVAIAALLFTVMKQPGPGTHAARAAAQPAAARPRAAATEPVRTATVAPVPQVVTPPARIKPAPAAVIRPKPSTPAVAEAHVPAPVRAPVHAAANATAPANETPRPAAPPAESARSDEGADWPLLCGVVTDAEGAPVAGAKVSLADLDLSARTDRRGRFCIAAPPGERTLSVLAQGFASARRLVALGPGGLELQVTLADRE